MTLRVVTAVMLLLTACASDGPPTIGTLRGKVAIEREGEVKTDLHTTIESYRDFLKSAPVTHPLYNDAALRLADLEMRSGQERSYRQWEQNYIEASKALADDGTEDGDFLRAVAMYEGLLSADPKDARNDRILYQLARAYEHLGKLPESLHALNRLVREFPASDYIYEAQFRRAEAYYALAMYREAARGYDPVLKRGAELPLYDRALYKQGWSYFKQDDYEMALDTFFALFEYKRLDVIPDAQALPTRADEELRADLLRAIDLCFAYGAGVAAVESYFSARGGRSYESVIYRNLGDYYLENDRIKDAADTYRAFFERYATHRDAPSLHQKMIRTYEQGKLFSMALSAKQDYVRRYGIGSLYERNRGAQLAGDVIGALKQYIGELASYYHASGQKRGRTEDTDTAIRWYQTYVRWFPQDAQTSRYHFMLAEALMATGHTREAGAAYYQTAYGYGIHENAAAAAYAGLTASAQWVAGLPATKRHEGERRWAEEAQRYVETFSREAQAASVRVKLAETWLELGEHTRAQAAAGQLVRHADVQLRRTAIAVMGHVAFERGDYAGAEEYYKEARTLSRDDAKLRRSLEQRIVAAAYKQAEQQAAAGDTRAAAQGYLRASNTMPETKLAASARYDAAALMLQEKNWQGAIEVLEGFRRSYPDHPLSPGVTEKLAVAYENNGDWRHAAREYETLAQSSATPEVRRQSLWLAASLYEKANERDTALRAYKDYVRTYPQPLEAALEARARLAALYGTDERASFWLREIVKAAINAPSPTPSVRTLAAQAAFALAAAPEAAYQRAVLNAPLQKSVKEKKRLMQAALDAYAAAGDYGVAEIVTAATYHVAELYHDFGRALLGAPPPAGLSNEEREEYGLLLEEQAFPFEQKAIEVHEMNTARAKDGVYDEWVRKSYAALSDLRPGRYAKMEHSDHAFAAID